MTAKTAPIALDTTEARRRRAEARWRYLHDTYVLWRRNRLMVLGTGIIAGLLLVTASAPLLATHNPYEQILGDRLLPLSPQHLFGTDSLGRDIYSRVVYGSRITLTIALLVAAISTPLGMVIGVFAGYLGGVVDEVLMRVADVFLAFPRLILAIAFAAALGPGVENAIIAIAVAQWPSYARLARAETLNVRNNDYIQAMQMLGAGKLRIMAGYIAPMCLSSIIVRMSLDMGTIILTAAGLGFLGLGAQPPMPEWGLMVSDGRQFLVDQWWVSTLPGLAILVVVMGFNLLGDGIRDVLDPHQRQA
ncbi:MAG TPA: nickel transporter permease [Candidatus Methylomirabilis sp.]|nr:nickel transporter permease [Candidatus Methylomirabilis sp.]